MQFSPTAITFSLKVPNTLLSPLFSHSSRLFYSERTDNLLRGLQDRFNRKQIMEIKIITYKCSVMDIRFSKMLFDAI